MTNAKFAELCSVGECKLIPVDGRMFELSLVMKEVDKNE